MNNRLEWTELGVSRTDKMMIWTVFPIVGGVAGWYTPALAKWASELPWVPFQGPLKLISSLSSQHGAWGTIAAVALGVLVGGMISMAAIKESLRIRLSDQEVRLQIHNEERTFGREDVAAVFMDNKQLVLLGTDGRELYREKPEKRKHLTEEFIRHGYDWREQDPFAHEYVRWVADCPELSPSVNALFLARDKAFGKDEKEDAEDLRRELSKLGVTVRDEGKRQYWRMHGRRP
ncbi:DUF308 domain-containing protein [Paenibacillus sp.]|uniref:YqeB family protein n=1 Tax=Paenibacillus sp. TaxID=58172 RepID=UPI0028231BE9|nr:DUF308 domain-containing protein [Paenibacillus sp.]MDR0270785.1 DUF308 domain-containing protein [Paenibacillus sp.]